VYLGIKVFTKIKSSKENNYTGSAGLELSAIGKDA
jgi:hypothetical protein